MKSTIVLTSALIGCAAAAVLGQNQAAGARQGAGLQAWQDSREAALLATCKTPVKPFSLPPAPPAAAAARPPAPVTTPVSPAIPDVIAARQTWKVLWETSGNNADGILGTSDGGILIAQNDRSDVIKLDSSGRTSVVYRDTNTGGALSRNTKGALFIVERAFNPAIWQLAPQRKLLANSYGGDPLDCLGSILNDLTADSRGGVYFTQGGLFYAAPNGMVTQYGESLQTNGVILSPDEKTLYVTNGTTVAAFDVQPDGALTRQRRFVTLPEGNGDGMTVDAAGRLYVTAGSHVHVFAPDGRLLGSIPGPDGLISLAFSGPNRKTLYAVVLTDFLTPSKRHNQVLSIPMLSQGYAGRAK